MGALTKTPLNIRVEKRTMDDITLEFKKRVSAVTIAVMETHMIALSDYLSCDAVALADRVRKGEVSARELTEIAIARAQQINPQINAVVVPLYDIARRRAEEKLTGPLAGVPFLIKDLFHDYSGGPATWGCAALKRADFRPRRHSEIVRRWLAAGLVVLGRTNTPEFGAKGITEPECWGPTHNPWQPDFSPGGSSGGAAAAVAAGIVPAAGASDGGGSIRIPAASTGLFGLKPGRGRTPSGPEQGEAIHGAAVNHVVSRTVRDSAWVLDATAGPETGSCFKIAPPPRPYAEEVGRAPGPLRIAYCIRSPLGSEVDPAAVTAVEQTARLLSDLGHDVVPDEPDINGIELARDFQHIWFAHLAALIQLIMDQYKAKLSEFELDSLAMAAMAKTRHGVDYVRSYRQWNYYGYKLSSFLSKYHLYMTPTLALPPPRIGEVKTPAWAAALLRAGAGMGLLRLIPLFAGIFEKQVLNNLKRVPFTQLANVTGVPAMSVPLHTFPNGLPLGIHFLADHGGEGLLFSLAGQLERAAPWYPRYHTMDCWQNGDPLDSSKD